MFLAFSFHEAHIARSLIDPKSEKEGSAATFPLPPLLPYYSSYRKKGERGGRQLQKRVLKVRPPSPFPGSPFFLLPPLPQGPPEAGDEDWGKEGSGGDWGESYLHFHLFSSAAAAAAAAVSALNTVRLFPASFPARRLGGGRGT